MNSSRASLQRLGLQSPLAVEIATRVVLFILLYALELARPFQRAIKEEELWLYKNPLISEKIPVSLLLTVGIGVPVVFVSLHYLTTGDKLDLVHALLGLSLTVLLTGIIVDVIKVSVGRPRPDFYYRCFPDGQVSADLVCLGEEEVVEEGRKSFPSGHTAWAFSCSGFLTLYLSGKLHLFGPLGRGQAWRVCAAIAPLLTASVASLTRIQDHKHHWEDVVVGGIIGLVVSLLCYLQHYPSPLNPQCDSPLTGTPYHSALRTPHTRRKFYPNPPALDSV